MYVKATSKKYHHIKRKIHTHGNKTLKQNISAKTLEVLNCLPRVLFHMDIIDICSLSCFWISIKVDSKFL